MKFIKITDSSREGSLNPYFSGWLKERYGECQAQVSLMTTLRLSSSVRDVARFSLGSVPYEIENWCKQFERPPQGVDDFKFIFGWEDEEGNHNQGSIERDAALKGYINKYPNQWKIVQEAFHADKTP